MGVNYSTKGITETVDIQDIRKFRGKWNTRKEYEVVKVVRDRFAQMQMGRRSSCPYASMVTDIQMPNIVGSSNDGVSTGSDWTAHWNTALKLWSMWHEYTDGRSNLKAPTTFAPIESAIAEFMDNQVKATLTATKEEDEGKAVIYEKILDHLFYEGNFQKVNNETFKSTLIYGSAITYVGWLKKSREVEIILPTKEAEKEVKKNKDAAKKRLQEEKKPLTRKEEIVEYDDIALMPVSIYEFFADPDARCMRGPAYESVDCIWRTTPSVEQFRAEFANSSDPWTMKENVDKVFPAYVAERMYTEGVPFFKTPQDIGKKNKIELIKYYNKQTDKYIVVANDVVLRDGPLPYNHKQLPFVLHKMVDFPDMFYGIGLPALMESNQSEEEVMKNMAIDQYKLAINPPIFINSQVFPDIDQQWERTEPGMKINVDGPVDGGSVRVFEMPGIKVDYFNMRNVLGEEAIQISGINPIMSSMPKSNIAVRTNMLLLESGLKHVRKYVKNWSYGYVDAIRQMIMLIKQKYPDTYTQTFDESGEVVKSPKSIIVRGQRLSENEEGAIEAEKINGVSRFEVRGEYLDLTGDLEVEIDIDALLPMSRTVKMQKVEQALAQLVPIISNPMIRNAPGMADLVQEYITTHALPHSLSENFQDANSKQDTQKAKDQEELMMRGEAVPGVPGESNSHKMSHLMALIGTQSELMQNPETDPQTVQIAMQFMQRISEHLATDDQEKSGNAGFKGGPQGQMIPQGGAIPTNIQQPQQPGSPNVGPMGQQVLPPLPPMQ